MSGHAHIDASNYIKQKKQRLTQWADKSKMQQAFPFVCDCDFKNWKNMQNFTT